MHVRRIAFVCVALLIFVVAAAAQNPPGNAPPVPANSASPAAGGVVPAAAPSPPPANAVAATVNGHNIPELAVYRALARENPKRRDEARKEVIGFLVDNALVDQYLVQMKIQVDPKEIEDRVAELRKEAAKDGKELGKVLESVFLTEQELRVQLLAALRWDKFFAQQAPEKVLRDFFDKNKTMFDGSQVHARHILIEPGANAEQAKTRAGALRQQLEAQVAQAWAKAPANADKLEVEKEKTRLLLEIFAKTAADHSMCPSKAEGGDLGFFPRAGAMVEPFARAAFALRPNQMSDVVPTEFGYHIILAVDFKPGKEVKFEEVKPFVHEIYSDRLRDAVVAAMRPRAQITIHPAPKQ